MGIIEQIKFAKTTDKLKQLANDFRTYKWASLNTF